MKRLGFTMLELVFVIVIMGIIGKFGVEFLAKAYKSFIFTQVNEELQTNTAVAVELIAKRLESRIKDSIIAKKNDNSFRALASVDPTTSQEYTVLEWVASDIDGFRGNSKPYWSGIADLELSSGSEITSPDTNTSAINTLITILSNNNSTLNDAALYFVGSSNDITSDYGWDGVTTTIDTQNGAMHPVNYVVGNFNTFFPDGTNFTDVYEYYKLAWTANAVVLSSDGNLTLYSDYQPWEGESYTNATQQNLLMQNVDTFQFMAIGSIVKIQVCINTDLVEDYSLCKEKTIY